MLIKPLPGGIFSPPVFPEEEKAQRAKILFTLLWVTMGAVSVAMTGLAFAQSQLVLPASFYIVVILAAGLSLLELNRRGHTSAASVLFLVLVITLVSTRALVAGGIRSPGVTMYYVFALAAGLLLGERAGIITAIICSAIALGLVVAEHFDFLPAQTIHYTALSYWWLNLLYMCLIVLLIRVASQAVRKAFDRMNSELAERQKAEQSLQVALEAGSIGVWQWAPATGALVWDDRMYAMYGVPRDMAVTYQTWASHVLPDDLTSQEEILASTARGGSQSQREFRIMTPNGIRCVYAAEQAFPGSGTQSARVIGINIDITERKKAEEEVGRIKQQLEMLIGQARIGIVVHHDFQPVKVNAEFLDMLGLSEGEALGINDIRDILSDGDTRRSQGREALLGGPGSRAFFEARCLRKNGHWTECEIREFPIQWEGQPSICAMVTDVTEKKRMEAQLRQAQRLEAVGQMTGGIAHDFNNLLTVILGNVEVLERKLAQDAPYRELAEMTRLAAERGADLTGRLLAFSRQQALCIQAIDINSHVANVSTFIRRILSDEIELRLVEAPGLWLASADAAQLENAIFNLAINSRDAMPNGGVLTIETANVQLSASELADLIEPLQPEGDQDQSEFVMIAVSDTGVGMDDETRLRAFDPFFTTKDVGKGSGLGLSMVYGFIRQLGGQIRLTSESGHGTSVKLYLPRAADGMKDADFHDAGPGTPMGGSERILLVEDHDLVRKQVAAQLAALGYDVTGAGDAIEALALLRTRGDFDLLFTDIVMPNGMNGRELAREAAYLRPGLPVLFTSGYTDNALAHQGRLDPSTNLLTKPYRLNDLAAKVRYAIDRSRRTRLNGST